MDTIRLQTRYSHSSEESSRLGPGTQSQDNPRTVDLIVPIVGSPYEATIHLRFKNMVQTPGHHK